MYEEYWQWYSAMLNSGPLAFGEAHSKPYARNTAVGLIKSNLVTKLFVERPEYPINGRMPGEILREHAQKVRDGSLGFYDRIDELGLAPANMGACDNETPWEYVVRWAVAKGIDVYYFDKSVLGDAGSAENMAARNDAMAETFHDNTDGLAIGVLLINGSDHFNGDAETGDLAHSCDISNDRVVIFSNE